VRSLQPPGAQSPLIITWVQRALCHLTLAITSGQRDPSDELASLQNW